MIKKLFIEGMSCKNCVNSVEKSLKSLEYVNNVEVDLSKGIAIVHSDKEVDYNEYSKAIEDLGFDLKKIE